MTPLRQRYIDDLRLKNFSAGTIHVYVHAVAKFAQHFQRSPDTLTCEEVRAYLVQLIDRGVSRGYTVICRNALRHLYRDTLKRPDWVVVDARHGVTRHWIVVPMAIAPVVVPMVM